MEYRCALCDEIYHVLSPKATGKGKASSEVRPRPISLALRSPDGVCDETETPVNRSLSPSRGICPSCRAGGASTPVLRSQWSEESVGAYQIGLVHAGWATTSDPASRNDYCGGCHFSVEGPAIKALDRIWHRECFQCEVCHTPLVSSSSLPPDSQQQEGEQGEPAPSLQFFLVNDVQLCERHFLEFFGDDDGGEEAEAKEGAEEEQQQEQHGKVLSDAGTGTGGTVAVPSSPPPSTTVLEGLAQGAGAEEEGEGDKAAPPLPVTAAGGGGGRRASSGGSSSSACVRPSASLSEGSMPAPAVRQQRAGSTRLGRSDSVSVAAWETRSETTHRAGATRQNQQQQPHRPTSLFDLRTLMTEAEADEHVTGNDASTTSAPPLATSAASLPILPGDKPAPPVSPPPPPLPPPPAPVAEPTSRQSPVPATPNSSRWRAGKERPPLTNGTALSYGLHVAARMVPSAADEERRRQRGGGHGGDVFGAVRHMELTYGTSHYFFWEESAPEVFEQTRRLFRMSERQYRHSMADLVGGQHGEGKSGCVFYHSRDGRLIIKSISEAEHGFLLRSLLPSYLSFMSARATSSLLPRFYGLYSVKIQSKPACRLVVMNNVFRERPPLQILQKYDLKGSLLKRCVTDRDVSERHVSVLKDLNFCTRHDGTDDHGGEVKGVSGGSCRCLRLGGKRRSELLASVSKDVEWLRQHNVMDYSLLVGIAALVTPHGTVADLPSDKQQALASMAAGEDERHRRYSLWCPIDNEDDGEGGGSSCGGGGGRCHVFLLGIVDILQEYNVKRRVETLFKTGLYSFEGKDPRGLSVIDPASYAKRFVAYIEQHTA